MTDPAGRNGTAVARTSDDAGFLERSELVFDPDTSELLAEREVLLERVDWVDAEPRHRDRLRRLPWLGDC